MEPLTHAADDGWVVFYKVSDVSPQHVSSQLEPHYATTRPMKRRTLFVVGGLLLALFFTPQLPPVRNALLRWGVTLAAQQGYTVTYRESAGNLWYNVRLSGLNVTGPGVNAAVDTLRLGYTLPALVTGILPLNADVAGVHGSLDLDALPLPGGASVTPPGAAPRRPRVRPLLRRAELSGVDLEVQGAPFSVPDARVTTLEVRQNGEALAFDAVLAVKDAVAEVSGQATLAPFRLSATVARADVTLAESYFSGIDGGTLSGTVEVDENGPRADLELQNGQVALIGLDLENVSGPVRVQGQKLTTELTGRALGGPLAGEVTVDLGARRWQADVTGDAKLAQAVTWLGRDHLSPAVVRVLEPTGSAAVALSAGGWQQVTVSGAATGQGELLGEPLRDLNVDFGFRSGESTTATADARLGGAPLSFSLTPEEGGFSLRADGTNLPLRGFEGDLAVDLEQQGGVLTGTAALDLGGEALGRAVQGRVQATQNGSAWRLNLSGQDTLGARASGQLELREGALRGAARVQGLELPGLENPVTLNARADGPLTDLPLTLGVGGPKGVRMATGGVRADADFSGAATATLKGGALRGVSGDFGPLNLTGAPGDLRYSLAPTGVSGLASGEVAVREGRLTRRAGRLETTARLETTDVRSAGVTLPDLNADVSLQVVSPSQSASPKRGDRVTAALKDADAGIDVQLRNGGLRGTFDGARVGALGDIFAVTGEVSGQAAKLTETLALDLLAQTPGTGGSVGSSAGKDPRTTLRAVGDAAHTRVSLTAAKGATLAGRTLGGALELSGDTSLRARRTALSGTLGGVGVEVNAAPDVAGRVRTQAGLSLGDETFQASFSSLERWETDGTLPLAELGDALGVPLTGTLRTTLARQGPKFSGQAALSGKVFGLPLRADATTQKGALTLGASTSLLGQPVTLSGQALPETDAALSLGPYGQVRLSGVYPALRASGSGQLPGFRRGGLEVAAQGWTLQGGLKTGIQLQLGTSRVLATRGPGGLRLDAKLQQRARWRGTPLTLAVDLTRTPQRPDGRVQGTLALGGSPLALSGSLHNLNISGVLAAQTLQRDLLGRVETHLNLDAFTQSYAATARWRRPDGSEVLKVGAEGRRGELSATAEADGLSARFSTVEGAPRWRLEADRYNLSKLPVRQVRKLNGVLDAQLDGTLGTRGGGYDGHVQLSSSLGSAQLTGTGAGLELKAAAAQGPLQADVSGTVLPALELKVQANAGDTGGVRTVRLNGSLTGTPAHPQFRASVQTTAQTLGGGLLRVPARRLELRASLAGGLSAALSGEATDVRLRGGRWAGRLALPFVLRGEPHRLAGTVAGALTEPTLVAELAGSTVQGPLSLSRKGLEGDLTVTPDLGAAPDARPGVDMGVNMGVNMNVQLRAFPDLSWHADFSGAATLPYRSLPATVEGRVSGKGVRYTGTGTATIAGEEIALELSGEAASVQARAEINAFRLEPLIPAEGTLSGDVRVTTNGEFRYFASLNAVGSAAGRPFDLTLSADRTSGLSLGGSAAGTSVSLTGPLPLRTLELKVANSEQPLELTTSLALGETLTLRGGGGWRGEALSLTGAYTPDLGDGTLELTLADAALNASVQATGTGRMRTVKAALTAPTGLLKMQPLRVDAEVTQTGQALAVTALDARLGATTLSLAGAVRPRTDVSGTLLIPVAGDPIALRLKSLETGYLAALTQGTLELRSVLKPGFIFERARLVGTLTRSGLKQGDLALESDLVWQEGAGFEGRTDLTVSRDDAGVTLELVGKTGLNVRGSGRYRGVEVATLVAQLSDQPWRDRRLSGRLELNAPVHELSPVWPGRPLRVVGSFGLSGDLTAPQLAGPLALRGALTASGRVRADRGAAEASLTGRGLNAVASVGVSGYRGTLSLDALDLSGVMPRLAIPNRPAAARPAPDQTVSDQATSGQPAPTLSGAVRATRTWGEAPQVQSELRLERGKSVVRGRVRLAERVSGALELDLHLRDLNPGLRGRLTGPLRFSAQGPLSGTLTLNNLGPAARPLQPTWRLGGQGTLSGTLSDPVIEAALTGGGGADGTLELAVSPRSGRLELTSDLSLDANAGFGTGFKTDFTLTRTRQGVSAAGTLGYEDFRAQLSRERGGVRLTGRSRLKGWRGLYTPERVSLTGPLESLYPQLGGRLELGGPADLGKLSGTLTGAAFGPVALGEVGLEAQAGQLTLQGEALAATIGLSADLPWTLKKLDLSLPGAGLSASGEGTRRRGDVSGTVRVASTELPVTARYGPQGAVVEAKGTLPVGALDLRARYDDGWQGYLNVTDRGRQVVESTLTGARAAPKLAGRLELASGKNAVRGNFSVGQDAAQLGVRLSSPQLSAPLTVTGSGWPLTFTLATPDTAVQLALRDGRLEPTGALELSAGPAELALRAEGGRLRVVASAPAAPGLALRTTLPEKLSDYGALLDGVQLTGVGRTEGTLSLRARPTVGFAAEALAWRAPAGTLSLTGSGSLGDARALAVQGRWQGAGRAALPWLRNVDVPFTAQLGGDQVNLESVSELGRAAAQFDLAASRLALQSNLTLGRGQVAADVSYTRADGPSGTVDLASVPVFTFGKSVATLGSQLTLAPQGVSGRGALRLAGGQADLSGQAGWARLLPAPWQRLTPAGGDALNAEVRLERFDLSSVPQLAARLPYLDAPVSGVATLSGAQIVGQLVAPDLRVSGTPLPTQVEFNGTLSALEARASVADSRLNVRYSRENGQANLDGLVTLEGFPLQTLAEAAVGASQVEAEVTGAARFEVPLGAPSTGYVRLATERLSLKNTGPESSGDTTEGAVALRFENGSLFVERAEFRGEGFWQASGILTPEDLDFTLEAQNADFTPLLSLVPRLAAFNVGAQGSLNVQASGSLSAPVVTLISPSLEVRVAGTSYRALETQASLSGGAFGLRSDLVGVAPISGSLELRGSGQVNLAPFATNNLALRFSGGAEVPTLGAVTNITGRIYPSSRGWQLDSSGELGAPFTVSGDLTPLDLTLEGEGLNVQARRVFVASSTTDVLLNVKSDALGFVISGDATARQAQLSLNRRGDAAQSDGQTGEAGSDKLVTDEPVTSEQGLQTPLDEQATGAKDLAAQDLGEQNLTGQLTGQEPPPLEPEVAPDVLGTEGFTDATAVIPISSVPERTANPVLERVRFDDVRIRAPQEVLFQEAFGNAELGVDLTLSGTAATPRLDGEAQTLRGSIRFSGEDFSLTRAVATFDPAQGAYPTLDLEAQTRFDQRRALGDATTLRFTEPSDSSFDVLLTITGSFEAVGGRRILDLESTLTSSARVQEEGSAPRPLDEAELVALLTLGRLQLDAPITAGAPLIGGNSLAGTVAESALDTAVDLLLVSELQNALGEVLGVDLLEIRTSALSTFLGTDGGQQNFGVSVKVGGYLSDNLFASVQVGRYDDPDQNVELSNEFLLRYTAAPLELNLAGGVDFLEQQPVPNFSLGLSYAVTPLISLDASLDTTALGRGTSVGFGVSFTW